MTLRSLIAGTFAFACLTLCAAQESGDGYLYRLQGRGWVQMAGVCNADPQQITCWKPTGEPDAKLSELLNAYFLVNPQQRLEIRYKHRSLMLVMKSMLSQNPGQGNVNFNGIQVDPGGALYQQGNIGFGGQGEESTTFYWYYPSESVTQIDATALLNTTTEPVKLPIKVETEVKLKGGTVRITKIEKGTETNPNVGAGYVRPKGPYWTVSYSLEGSGPEPITSIYANVFDKNGVPISQVDDRGNPVAPKPGRYAYNGFQPNWPVASVNAGVITLGVNPDKVGSMTVTGTAQKKLTFKNISLGPNRGAAAEGGKL